VLFAAFFAEIPMLAPLPQVAAGYGTDVKEFLAARARVYSRYA
jgi:hypothetical protein